MLSQCYKIYESSESCEKFYWCRESSCRKFLSTCSELFINMTLLTLKTIKEAPLIFASTCHLKGHCFIKADSVLRNSSTIS